MNELLINKNCYPANYLRKLLIYNAFILSCIQYFLSWHIEESGQIIRYTIAICLLLSINYEKWDRFKLFLCIFLCIAFLYRRLLIVWTLFTLIYQIDYFKISLKDISKISLVLVIFELFIQIEGVLLGLFENEGIVYMKSNTITYDLGTGNANRCASLFLSIVILSYVIFKDRNRAIFIIFSSIIAAVSFIITGSRTTILCIIIIIVLSIIYWKIHIRNYFKYLIAIFPILMFGLTFYLAFNLNDNKGLNEMASGRLWYIVKFTQDFTFNDWLIGAPRTIDEPLDSSYLEIIHTGGISLCIFLCIAYYITSIKYFNLIKPYLPIIITMLIAGLTESILLRPSDLSIIFWMLMFQGIIKYKPII